MDPKDVVHQRKIAGIGYRIIFLIQSQQIEFGKFPGRNAFQAMGQISARDECYGLNTFYDNTIVSQNGCDSQSILCIVIHVIQHFTAKTILYSCKA